MEFITELLGAVFGVLGAGLIVKKIRLGWISWIISDFFLIAFSIIACYWWLLTLNAIYLGFSTWGWFDWRPKPIETNYG